MNASAQLAVIEADLNTAIAGESFAQAGELLDRYAAVLERSLGAIDDDVAATIQADAAAFFERIGTAIKAVRAGAQTESARLRGLAAYAPEVRAGRAYY
jgi:hypothetical protein